MDFAVPRHHATEDTSCLPEPGATAFALLGLSPGTSGRITGLADNGVGGVLVKRLRNLGFVPGRIATPLRRTPMGDPAVYRVPNYELCLRRQEARLIQVTTAEAESRIILQPRPVGRHVAGDPEVSNTGETLRAPTVPHDTPPGSRSTASSLVTAPTATAAQEALGPW